MKSMPWFQPTQRYILQEVNVTLVALEWSEAVFLVHIWREDQT